MGCFLGCFQAQDLQTRYFFPSAFPRKTSILACFKCLNQGKLLNWTSKGGSSFWSQAQALCRTCSQRGECGAMDFIGTSSPPVNLHWTTNSVEDFTRQEKSGKLYKQHWASSYCTTETTKMHFYAFLNTCLQKMEAAFIWVEKNQGTLSINIFLCLSLVLFVCFSMALGCLCGNIRELSESEKYCIMCSNREFFILHLGFTTLCVVNLHFFAYYFKRGLTG